MNAGSGGSVIAALAWGVLDLFLIVYITWAYYLAVMALKRAKDAGTISTPALVLGYPLLLSGVLMDFVANMGPFTIIFRELPQEIVVTRRLERHIAGPDGWRKSVAKWFCEKLLDTFDPTGCHCKK